MAKEKFLKLSLFIPDHVGIDQNENFEPVEVGSDLMSISPLIIRQLPNRIADI